MNFSNSFLKLYSSLFSLDQPPFLFGVALTLEEADKIKKGERLKKRRERPDKDRKVINYKEEHMSLTRN